MSGKTHVVCKYTDDHIISEMNRVCIKCNMPLSEILFYNHIKPMAVFKQQNETGIICFSYTDTYQVFKTMDSVKQGGRR